MKKWLFPILIIWAALIGAGFLFSGYKLVVLPFIAIGGIAGIFIGLLIASDPIQRYKKAASEEKEHELLQYRNKMRSPGWQVFSSLITVGLLLFFALEASKSTGGIMSMLTILYFTQKLALAYFYAEHDPLPVVEETEEVK